MVNWGSNPHFAFAVFASRLHLARNGFTAQKEEMPMLDQNGISTDNRAVNRISGATDTWRRQTLDGASAKATSAGPTDSTVVDWEGTLRRLGGDRELLATLAKVFAEDAPGLLDKLKAAVASMQGEQIRSAAHALRGLAANFGAPAIMAPLRQLEEIGARDDLGHAKLLLEQVCDNTTKLQESLDQQS
jgi:HPt (histidine-containing phosphotransfer) domain-containing protein